MTVWGAAAHRPDAAKNGAAVPRYVAIGQETFDLIDQELLREEAQR